jgi:endoglucanase
MHEPSHAFLKQILETPSPSGFERPVQDVVRAWAREYADEVRTDRHGNVIAVRYPIGASPRDPGSQRVMLAGHCDQIALMVQHIDEPRDVRTRLPPAARQPRCVTGDG